MNDYSSPESNATSEGRRRSIAAVDPMSTAQSNVGSAIDRIDHALEMLQEAVERNRMRIDPFLDNTARPGGDEKGVVGERLGSQIQQSLHERADRIERITAQLRDVNERIDL